MRDLLRGMARDLGVSLGDSPKPVRDYSDAVPGSRAEGRGIGGKGWTQRWIAGDFAAGLFCRRREALKRCPRGVLPVLVWVHVDEDGFTRSQMCGVKPGRDLAGGVA